MVYGIRPPLTQAVQDANQAFVTIFFMKAVFIFISTTFINGWYFRVGPSVVFNSFAGMNLAVSALTIPAYIFGKRFRSLVSLALLCPCVILQLHCTDWSAARSQQARAEHVFRDDDLMKVIRFPPSLR